VGARARRLQSGPYFDARYSLLQGVLDRADAGVRLKYGDHILEPALEYFFPTFDGDSIFNVFSIEPTTDARLSYQYAPAGPLRGSANLWLRKYAHEDGTSSLAGGGELGVQRALGTDWRGRVDALWDDGYGGRRVGGTAEAMWRPANVLWLRGRAIVLDVREDGDLTVAALARDVVTSTLMLSSTWRVADSVALHAIAEADYDDVHALQTRAIAILDLAFLPEP